MPDQRDHAVRNVRPSSTTHVPRPSPWSESRGISAAPVPAAAVRCSVSLSERRTTLNGSSWSSKRFNSRSGAATAPEREQRQPLQLGGFVEAAERRERRVARDDERERIVEELDDRERPGRGSGMNANATSSSDASILFTQVRLRRPPRARRAVACEQELSFGGQRHRPPASRPLDRPVPHHALERRDLLADRGGGVAQRSRRAREGRLARAGPQCDEVAQLPDSAGCSKSR
jgi:hypothetical protein